MQDRYAGDIGDFGKFYLLRKVFAPIQKNIGIVWYKYDNENHNADGLHIGYLCNDEYISEDEELVTKLQYVVAHLCNRSILQLEEQEIILEGKTVYFSEDVSFHNLSVSARKEKRDHWLIEALNTVKDCDIVFFDPDNGLEAKSAPKGSKKSGKHVYYNEVMKFFSNEKTQVCIVYHHLGRTGGTHKKQIKTQLNKLRGKLIGIGSKAKNFTIFSIVFKPFSPRAFFIIVDNGFLRMNDIELDLKEICTHRKETKQKWDYLFKITSESEEIQYIVDNQT